ncbi:hypothetical protein BGZ73_006427 [Actinomortierella ambigua]|nr:hypothetical protein BGZ73_006427 [Actinomortierella ambigua]
MPIQSLLSSPTTQIVQSYLNNPALGNIKNIIFIVFVYKLLTKLNDILIVKGPTRTYKELKAYIASLAFRYAKMLPSVQDKINKEMAKSTVEIEGKVAPRFPHLESRVVLPKHGITDEQLREELQSLSELPHSNWEGGRVSGAVYTTDPHLKKLTVEAYGMFSSANPLHPEVFPGIRKMEAEACAMVSALFNIPATGGACMTSGGTESILMSVKAHREWAKEKKGITQPEIVAPYSIHSAFDKACHYFGIKLIHVPMDKDMRVNLKAVASAINKNTIMLAGSAVNYPYGTMDDIEGLSKLALKHKVGLHVDCCLGSFMVAFAEKAGYKLPLFDFRVPGVTAISCDTHKYGFAPKGTSVIMYRSKELRRYQYFYAPNWTGGIYASPSIAGSRPGALVAGCWTTLMHIGEQGYTEHAKTILGAKEKVRQAIEKIPNLYVYGKPLTSVVAFNSDKFNIYDISDALHKRGWHLCALQKPAGLHWTSTLPSAAVVDDFIRDLTEVMKDFENGTAVQSGATAGLYGTAASVPSEIVSSVAGVFIDSMYKP